MLLLTDDEKWYFIRTCTPKIFTRQRAQNPRALPLQPIPPQKGGKHTKSGLFTHRLVLEDLVANSIFRHFCAASVSCPQRANELRAFTAFFWRSSNSQAGEGPQRTTVPGVGNSDIGAPVSAKKVVISAQYGGKQGERAA